MLKVTTKIVKKETTKYPCLKINEDELIVLFIKKKSGFVVKKK